MILFTFGIRLELLFAVFYIMVNVLVTALGSLGERRIFYLSILWRKLVRIYYPPLKKKICPLTFILGKYYLMKDSDGQVLGDKWMDLFRHRPASWQAIKIANSSLKLSTLHMVWYAFNTYNINLPFPKEYSCRYPLSKESFTSFRPSLTIA